MEAIVYNYRHGGWIGVPLESARAVVASQWMQRVLDRSMTPASASRYSRVFSSFARFANATGVDELGSVDELLCERFVAARLPDRDQASRSTRRFRLTVLRTGFGAVGAAGVTHGDPTRTIRVAVTGPDSPAGVPLYPGEASRLRLVARMRPRDTLRPATVELALAGLNHGEIARAVVADLDAAASRLIVAGSGRSARSLALDDVALRVLAGRVEAQRRGMRRMRLPWDPSVVPSR